MDGKGTRPEFSIATVCRVLWNGGVQRVAINQHQALLNLGYNCELIFLRAVPAASYSLPSRTRIFWTGQEPRRRLSKLLGAITGIYAAHRGPEATVDLDLLWKIRRDLRRFSVVTFNDQYAALIGAYNRIFHSTPYVLVLHEFFPRVQKGLFQSIAYLLADLLDAFSILVAPEIVTTSSKVATRLNQIVPGRVTLARIGCTPLARRHKWTPDARKRVLTLSVWDRGRHPEVYVETAKSLPELEFTLAGTWPDFQYYQRFCELAEGAENLTVTGPITEATKESLLSSHQFYIRFGYNESGPGMGGLEALERGSIVITNTGLGLSEIITSGVDGFICGEGTADEAVRTLRMVESLDDLQLAAVSDAALDLCRRNTWKRHSEQLASAAKRAALRVSGLMG